MEKNLNELLSRKCEHLWVLLFSDLCTKYRPQNVSLRYLVFSLAVNSFGIIVHQLSCPLAAHCMHLKTSVVRSIDVRRGNVYAHLVIMVIWGIKGFFTKFVFMCKEQKSTSFCIKCSKTEVARVASIDWVGKNTPLSLEIWWQHVNIRNNLDANSLNTSVFPQIEPIFSHVQPQTLPSS